jgi:hypothetical protein
VYCTLLAKRTNSRVTAVASAADAATPWTVWTFDRFGLPTRLAVKSGTCLYYTATGEQSVTVILPQNLDGDRPLAMFFCTDPTLSMETVLNLYADWWATEVTYCDAKQLLGLEEPANRTQPAVGRTAPMALVRYSLVVGGAAGWMAIGAVPDPFVGCSEGGAVVRGAADGIAP